LSITHGGDKRVFIGTWENPHPELMVQTIDFISFPNPAVPFLIAITAEP
jgi:hypothetical protein